VRSQKSEVRSQSPVLPAGSLKEIARILRQGETVISDHVVEPAQEPVLGLLCASGPRASEAPGEYSLVIEAVREGFLLHYGSPRLLAGHDPDLALLAGDYLYALGIKRLASLGDSGAVRELSDLISLVAEGEAESRREVVPSLWLAATIAVGCGSSEGHEQAKQRARALDPGAAKRLWEAASATAASCGLGHGLGRAAEAIDFRLPRMADG
jgi:hypothetical protein